MATKDNNTCKVTLNDEILIDLTDSNVTATEVADGFIFYTANGARAIGSLKTQIILQTIEQGSTLTIEAVLSSIDTSGLRNGDCCIITDETITPSIVSSYIYSKDDNIWLPLGLNALMANNIYFSTDLKFSKPFGKFAPTSGTGNYTIPAAGKSLMWLLNEAYAEDDINFNVTMPFINLTAGTAQGYRAYEVGTTATPTYSVSFNAGSYPYGPATGVTLKDYSITLNGITKTEANGTFEILVTDNLNKKVEAYATYNAATNVPDSSLGNPVPDKQISAGQTSKIYGAAITGYRSIFYGYISKDISSLTSADIRNLTNGGNYNTPRTIEIKANGSTTVKYFVVAIPAMHNRGGITKVESTNGLINEVTGQWNINGLTRKVADARGGDNGQIDYNISYWSAATIDPATVHKVYLA